MFVERILRSVSHIKHHCSLHPMVGITLGSGLGAFVDRVNVEFTMNYTDIPGFNPPTIPGHGGRLVMGHIGDVPVVVLQGRIHFYEGHELSTVVHPTRVLARLGIKSLVLTNAAGGIGEGMKPGHFMVIEDHINLTGNNPIIGPNMEDLGPRFPDMTETYCPKLRRRMLDVLEKKNIPHSSGVYCGVLGPSYETPAEVRMIKQLGAHAVGMSTVPEAIAARHMGIPVSGVSCITNLASGLSPHPLSHDEVKQVAKQVESLFCDFLYDYVAGLGDY